MYDGMDGLNEHRSGVSTPDRLLSAPAPTVVAEYALVLTLATVAGLVFWATMGAHISHAINVFAAVYRVMLR